LAEVEWLEAALLTAVFVRAAGAGVRFAWVRLGADDPLREAAAAAGAARPGAEADRVGDAAAGARAGAAGRLTAGVRAGAGRLLEAAGRGLDGVRPRLWARTSVVVSTRPMTASAERKSKRFIETPCRMPAQRVCLPAGAHTACAASPRTGNAPEVDCVIAALAASVTLVVRMPMLEGSDTWPRRTVKGCDLPRK